MKRPTLRLRKKRKPLCFIHFSIAGSSRWTERSLIPSSSEMIPIVTGLPGEKRSKMWIIFSARGVSCMSFTSFPGLFLIVQYFTSKYVL